MSDFSELMENIKTEYKRHNLIGELLFDYFDDQDFENKIYEMASPEIRSYINFSTGTCDHPEYILAALTLIALKYYDGNFWDNVTEKLESAMGRNKEVVFHNKLREFLREYNNSSVKSSRLIDLPVTQSIVPANFMYGYFLFCYDIYYYNLRCSLRTFDKSDLKFVFDSLKNQISDTDNSDTLNVRGFKTYALKQSTKRIIINRYGIDSLINLTEKVIRIIDNYYWDKEQIFMSSYFKTPYEKWVNTVNQEEKRRGVSEAKNRTEFVRWTPKFVLKNNRVYIETREDNISDIYDKSKLVMEIYEDYTTLIEKRENLHASDMIGGYRLKSEIFEIKNPLNHIVYKLKCGDSVIYESDLNLDREFILFGKNGNEIKNHTDHDNEMVGFVLKKNELIQNCSQKIERSFYNLWYQTVNKDSQYIIADKLVNFISIPESGINGDIAKNAYFMHDMKNNQIYNKVHQIVISFKENPSLVVLNINDKRFKLDSESYVNIITKNDYTTAIIDCSNFEDDFYHVWFSLLGTKKKLDFDYTFVIDSEFEVHTEYDNGYKFIVSSSQYETTPFDFELSDKWELQIFFDYKSIENLSVVLTFDKPIYKLNNQWHTFDEYIWRDDLFKCPNVSIAGVKYKTIQILDDKEKLIIDKMNVTKSAGTALISTSSFHSYSFDRFYINVVDMSGEEYKVNIVSKIIFDSLDLVYNESIRSLSITPKYLGRGDINLELSFDNETKDYVLSNGKCLVLQDIKSFVYYLIRVHVMDFSTFSDKELYRRPFIHYDMAKLENSKFKIVSGTYYKFEKNIWYPVYNKLEETYAKIDKKITDGVYEIQLYRKIQKDGNTVLMQLSNLFEQQIEFVTKIDDKGYCKAVIFSEDDLVLYYPKGKSIFNGDHGELYPIEEFDLKFWR